jgi:hypothetical protein
MTARERDVQNAIMLHVGARPYVRLWRQNVGVAVPIGVVKRVQGMLEAGRVNEAKDALRRARVIRFGVKGAADLSGVLACGMRLELEVKRKGGKQSPDQVKFQGVMDRMGCLYAVVDSEDAADAVLDTHLGTCTVCSRRTSWRTT